MFGQQAHQSEDCIYNQHHIQDFSSTLLGHFLYEEVQMAVDHSSF